MPPGERSTRTMAIVEPPSFRNGEEWSRFLPGRR